LNFLEAGDGGVTFLEVKVAEKKAVNSSSHAISGVGLNLDWSRLHCIARKNNYTGRASFFMNE
jgi:hypothetical protein